MALVLYIAGSSPRAITYCDDFFFFFNKEGIRFLPPTTYIIYLSFLLSMSGF